MISEKTAKDTTDSAALWNQKLDKRLNKIGGFALDDDAPARSQISLIATGRLHRKGTQTYV
jgi:hypothetical protein